jgi:hypothetical protein
MSSDKVTPSTQQPVCSGSDSSGVKARKLVDDLDFECRIGEEPYEMEDTVQRVGREIGELFANHMERNLPSFMPTPTVTTSRDGKAGGRHWNDAEAQHSLFVMHMEILFNFIYLISSQRSRSITRYSERLLEQMLIESSQELGGPELLQFPVFYGIFGEAFTFLEGLGIEVRAPVRIRQLRAIQRRMMAYDPGQFARN